MKKRILAMLMASVMVLGLAACGGGSEPAADSADLPTVGVLIYKYDDTYISTVRNALEAALDGKAEVIMQDGKGDQATQNDQLDVMIEKGVDVLAVNMVDAKAAAGVVEKAKEAVDIRNEWIGWGNVNKKNIYTIDYEYLKTTIEADSQICIF